MNQPETKVLTFAEAVEIDRRAADDVTAAVASVQRATAVLEAARAASHAAYAEMRRAEARES